MDPTSAPWPRSDAGASILQLLLRVSQGPEPRHHSRGGVAAPSAANARCPPRLSASPSCWSTWSSATLLPWAASVPPSRHAQAHSLPQPQGMGLAFLSVAQCDAGAALGPSRPPLFSASPFPLDSGSSSNSSSSSKPPVLVTSWGERMEPDLKPLLQPFHPIPLLNTVLKNALLAYLPLLEQYLPQENLQDLDLDMEPVEGEAEGKEAPPKPPAPPLDFIKPAYSAAWSIMRELGVGVLRRVIERVVVQYVEPRVGWALTKDTHRSAKNKAKVPIKSYSAAVERFNDTFSETFTAHLLGSVASLLLQFKVDFVQFLRFFYSHRKAIRLSPQLLDKHLARLQRRILAHASKCLGALTGASAGAALGIVLWPSGGYPVGFMLGDMLGAAAVNKYVDPWVVRIQVEYDRMEQRSAERVLEEEEREKQRKKDEDKEKAKETNTAQSVEGDAATDGGAAPEGSTSSASQGVAKDHGEQ